MVTEIPKRKTLDCGCSYVLAGAKWWQVIACPDHDMTLRPLDFEPHHRVD